ncbi:olfactory receptor 13A1-like [Vombatus ursinus]|uniref:olfactory receptor 13A1-like n=1 Tax=Vombatus ursinus TaxID=29139 RepID=UPI000FFDB4E8|nr:olfactory receptor 13A1-like [Vombatus ursinus]
MTPSPSNHSSVAEFTLQSFSENPQVQIFLFSLFLGLFILAFTGNSLIVIVISLNPGLYTPMYFFLINLALMDVLSASTVVPKLLHNLMTKNTISYGGCIDQIYFLSRCMGAELLLFTAMAYDHYVAICQPLHYSTIMSKAACCLIASAVWAISGTNATINIIMTVRLSFCGPDVLDHFFCEIPPSLPLSCSSTYINNVMVLVADMFFALFNFLLILVSYGFIISSILKIRSKKGKKRAFSTCSSHLIVVTMYYCPKIYIYILPGLGQSLKEGKVASVFYTIVTPALNPLFYSLRNKDVKIALKKLCPFLRKLLAIWQTDIAENNGIKNIICTTTVVANLLENLVEEKKAISFVGCMTQMMGGLDSGMHTVMLVQLSFCGPNVIDHFFCEIPPILPLPCSSIQVNELMTLVTDLLLGGANFFLTIMSYGFIIANILKIQSEEGKKRAFSTCSSHLMVVTMYYFAVFCAYISPSARYSPEKGKAVAVLYTTVSPAVNPLIYTLRDKDVKAALRKLLVLTVLVGVAWPESIRSTKCTCFVFRTKAADEVA